MMGKIWNYVGGNMKRDFVLQAMHISYEKVGRFEDIRPTIRDTQMLAQKRLKANDLWFILAKVEPGAGDVPAAALDSQENKYLFVRYIEKSENVKILTSTLSRASEPRSK